MKRNVLILVVLLVLAGGFLGYKYLYHGHRDIGAESPEYNLSVKELHDEFVTNDSLANINYSNETIEIDGKVTAFDPVTRTIIIDEKLSAVLKKKLKTPLAPGDPIKIKGRFVGYDDLLEELKVDQAVILN